MRIADVFVAVRADMSDLDKGLKNLDSNLKGIGQGLSSMGRTLTTNVTLPILAAGGATTKLALDFERTMGQLVGLAGVPAAEIDRLTESINALSLDTGKGPQELAEAFYFVASAGFEANEALEVLEVSAKGSAAGMGSVQDIAKVLGGVINAYGKENLTAAAAADTLTAAVAEGAAEATSFANALPQVIPTAAMLGVELHEVVGAMAAMTTTGQSAEMAAVGLNQVFTTLLKPTSDARDTLADYGLTAEGLRKQLSEEGLVSVLRTLEQTFGDNDEAMTSVFGNVRAMRAAFSLLGLDAEQLDGIMSNVAESSDSLDDAFAAIPEDVLAFDRAMAELQVTGIQLGKDVLPTVVDILGRLSEGVRNVANWWKRLDDDTKQTIINMALLAAAAGPVLSILGKLVGVARGVVGGLRLLVKGIDLFAKGILNLPTALGYLDLALGNAKTAFLAVRTAAVNFAKILAGPVGIAIAAFALGMQTDFLGMRTRFEKDMKDMGDAANRFAMNFGDQAKETEQAAERFGVSADEMRDRVNSAMSRMGLSFEDALQAVTQGLSGYDRRLDESTDVTEEAMAAWSGMYSQTADAIVAEYTDMNGDLVTVFEDGSVAVNGAFGAMTEEQIRLAEEMRQAVLEEVQDMIAGIANLYDSDEQAAQAAQDFVESISTPFKDTDQIAAIVENLLLTQIPQTFEDGSTETSLKSLQWVNDQLVIFDTLAPGLLQRGRDGGSGLLSGMEEYEEPLKTFAITLAGDLLNHMTLAEAMRALGYDGLADYFTGMENAERDRKWVVSAIASRAVNALTLDASSGGASIIASWINGMWWEWNRRRSTIDYFAAQAGNVFGRSLPRSGPLQGGVASGGFSIIQSWFEGMAKAARSEMARLAQIAADAKAALAIETSGVMGGLTPAFAGLASAAPLSASVVSPNDTPTTGNTYVLHVNGVKRVVKTAEEAIQELHDMGAFGEGRLAGG